MYKKVINMNLIFVFIAHQFSITAPSKFQPFSKIEMLGWAEEKVHNGHEIHFSNLAVDECARIHTASNLFYDTQVVCLGSAIFASFFGTEIYR